MLSKSPVLRFYAALLFLLKLFSSLIYCVPKIDDDLSAKSKRFFNSINYNTQGQSQRKINRGGGGGGGGGSGGGQGSRNKISIFKLGLIKKSASVSTSP